MKSVLISIRPRWCELIAGGKKTVEVRKTRPKLETPFKVYIYRTKGVVRHLLNDKWWNMPVGGNIIGEFVCDFIEPVSANNRYCISKLSCVPLPDLYNYAGAKGLEGLNGWHISNLVLYDKPKELGEFLTVKCTNKKGSCRECKTKPDCIKRITRPPQSWFYVEEVKDK